MPPLPADQDPYALLGVPPAASAAEIRLAYRQRAMLWHPDRNRHADAEETFKRIRSAYEVLRDPARRADYDRHAAAGAKRPHAPAARPAAAAPRERRAPSAPDVRRQVCITLDQQLRGGRVDLKVSRTEYCTACGGSGVARVRVRCETCSGQGSVRPPLGLFAFFLAAPTTCTDCAGEGVRRPPCAACGGSGALPRKTGRLRFDLPAGIPPGGSLRVRGHGRRGRGATVSGDLLVKVSLATHPLFEPDFPHLRCAMPVSVFRAIAGGIVEVPTLDGPVAVSLPAVVADGTELRLTGRGMLNGATGKRGDLLVRLRLVRPRALSEAQRELLARLERLAADDPAQLDWERRRRAAEDLRRPVDRDAA